VDGTDLPELSADAFNELITRETDQVELKTGLGQKPLQEVLLAMSSTTGGHVFIGVTDDRRISGRRRDQGVDDAIHQAALSARNVGRYAISQMHVAAFRWSSST
jgi:predicted HTH transcriptional regulator